MSKILKIALVCAYSVIFIQYITTYLNNDKELIELEYITHIPSARFQVSKHYVDNFTTNISEFKKLERFSTDLKYILKYTKPSLLRYSTTLFPKGQGSFIQNKCEYINCYVTNNINQVLDVRNFDAILFDMDNELNGVTLLREPYQKYVFLAREPAVDKPLCNSSANNFYNLTWSYKLNSDIHWTHITIFDQEGNNFGPRIDAPWYDNSKPKPSVLKPYLQGKKKAAAWFLNDCAEKTKGGDIASAINKELTKYGLRIDTFGWCGDHPCPHSEFKECLKLLTTTYYFYLSFEMSISEDFVTEKILFALENYAVPIVFGGANYSRFLPPGSYIDANQLNASQVVDKMYEAIKNQEVYENYFKWRNYYVYKTTTHGAGLCELCRILNEDQDKQSVYENLQEWWNQKNACSPKVSYSKPK